MDTMMVEIDMDTMTVLAGINAIVGGCNFTNCTKQVF